MDRRRLPNHWIIFSLVVLPFPVQAALATEPSTNVNGTVSEIEGVRVLRVWGSPEERGYAHGFLLADTIVELAESYLAHGPLGGSLERYEKEMLPKLGRMKIDPRHEAEMQGVLAGLEAKRGGPAQIGFLGRPLRYEDVAAINCTGDFVRSGCSSFAAWGKLTKDGQTIAGRNMDWPVLPSMVKTPLVLVNAGSPGDDARGFVSITWPSFVGCITGMNAEGVTVATHDAGGRPATGTTGFTPYCWTFRLALESAGAETAIEDVIRIVRNETSMVGNNMMLTRPYGGRAPGGVVLEFDADRKLGKGVTTRMPEWDSPFVVCTNHFRDRTEPIACQRYHQLQGGLSRLVKAEGKRHVTVDRAWKMLAGVSMDGVLTYHSVVFEPNKRLMHVAFAEQEKHASKCKHVTLDVTELLAGDYPGGR
ncbi:MAG: C45 family autoproteolytic acyltransferase/hydrolase [Phycisphaerae bacterium]